jgi:Ser/Thr protein kinase RdoA (MazF antagonist)
MKPEVESVAGAFPFGGERIHMEPYGCGHINDTYAVYVKYEFARPARYILQRVNRHVFKDPARLMGNILGVTEHIAAKLEALGEDPRRQVLRVIRTKEGQPLRVDAEGNCWRAYAFIDDATSYQQATPELLEQSGAAFGRFARMLDDYPVHTLYESIPDFHNTRVRMEACREAAARDPLGRADGARAEIRFALAREEDAGALTDRLAAGVLPLRVTHNDTKLNNVMIDNETGQGICVIDLDTVMPGLSLYDFGDAIRFGASTGAEDETELSKVSVSLTLFEAFTRGYLSQARLTPAELSLLPFAAKLMTYECGVRFLTDYLLGDVYFKTSRPRHNLDRCRTQFKLVSDMEGKLGEMAAIVGTYS